MAEITVRLSDEDIDRIAAAVVAKMEPVPDTNAVLTIESWCAKYPWPKNPAAMRAMLFRLPEFKEQCTCSVGGRRLINESEALKWMKQEDRAPVKAKPKYRTIKL